MDDAVVVAREVALTLALDLDDVGAEVGQVSRSKRRRDGLLEGDDADAGEGEVRLLRSGAPSSRTLEPRSHFRILRKAVLKREWRWSDRPYGSRRDSSPRKRYDGGVSENETAERSGRWQRREQRRVSERSRMQKHGAAHVRESTPNAIQKRLTQAATKKKR